MAGHRLRCYRAEPEQSHATLTSSPRWSAAGRRRHRQEYHDVEPHPSRQLRSQTGHRSTGAPLRSRRRCSDTAGRFWTSPFILSAGEHVPVILSTSSFCYAAYRSPSSPKCCRFEMAKSSVRKPWHPEARPSTSICIDKVILLLDPYRKTQSPPKICALYLLWKTPYEKSHISHINPTQVLL